MAVPFFVLMGNALNQGKSGQALMELANQLVGSLWGGLASVSIVVSMFFGGCSGSAVADASSVGSVLIPEMVRRGYDKGYSGAVNAASSTIGIIIPPSIPMILYGWVTEVSIRDLFLAGLIPGVLVGTFQIIVAAYLGYKRKYFITKRPPAIVILRQFKRSLPAMFTPILVMGGILGGVYTTTEAAIFGALYVILIELVIYKGLTIGQLYRIIIDSAKMTGVVIFLIATSFMLTYVIMLSRVPTVLSAYLAHHHSQRHGGLAVYFRCSAGHGLFSGSGPVLVDLYAHSASSGPQVRRQSHSVGRGHRHGAGRGAVHSAGGADPLYFGSYRQGAY